MIFLNNKFNFNSTSKIIVNRIMNSYNSLKKKFIIFRLKLKIYIQKLKINCKIQ